jgi:hypothetical protein
MLEEKWTKDKRIESAPAAGPSACASTVTPESA